MTRFEYRRLNKDRAAVILVDFQTGLVSLTADRPPDEFKNSVLAMADIAAFFSLPTIVTTGFESGPNGPLMPELREMLPKAVYIPRSGLINPWDNADFVRAVRVTGRTQLIIAGALIDVGAAFPALSAVEAGYEVFAVTDASGAFTEAAKQAACQRMLAGGVQLSSWFGAACELQRDWRIDTDGLTRLFCRHLAAYRNLVASRAAIVGESEKDQAAGNAADREKTLVGAGI